MRTRLFPLTALAALVLLASCRPARGPLALPRAGGRHARRHPAAGFRGLLLAGQMVRGRVPCTPDALDGAVRRDDFCEAAATARLAARMKAYLGLPAPSEEEAAAKYRRAGLNCPRYEALPPRDAAYRELMDAGGLGRAGQRPGPRGRQPLRLGLRPQGRPSGAGGGTNFRRSGPRGDGPGRGRRPGLGGLPAPRLAIAPGTGNRRRNQAGHT